MIETPQQVDLLLQRGWEIRHEDTRAALELNQAAHAMALRIDHAGGVAWGLLRIALCGVILAEDVDLTLGRLQQAAALMASLTDARGEVEALNLLAHLQLRCGDTGRAIELYGRCLTLRRRLGDREGEAGALSNLALALGQARRHADALELAFASLELGQSIGVADGQAYALNNIATLLLDTDDPQATIDHAERALALTATTRDRALECSTRVVLGRALAALGREALALAQLGQAVVLARRTGNRGDLVVALIAAGEALQQFGQLDEAEARLDEAMQLQPALRDRAIECALLCALGHNRRLRGDTATALTLLGQALQAAQAAGSESGAARAHRQLAELHEADGNPAAALDHFRRFYTAEQRIGGREAQRRIRAVLNRADLAQVRREAQQHEQRATALSSALDELGRQTELLEKLAREDGLTGVANRRWLDLSLQKECERARRFGHALSVAMVDVDDFKAVNDALSHAVGDAVLRQVAHLLRDACRACDLVGRYGGEEFLLVLAETPADNAAVLCEKLRAKVAAFDWPALHPGLQRLTVSIGLAGVDQQPDAARLTAAADQALYAAKLAGKDRVCR